MKPESGEKRNGICGANPLPIDPDQHTTPLGAGPTVSA
jgi:hypothetical protein